MASSGTWGTGPCGPEGNGGGGAGCFFTLCTGCVFGVSGVSALAATGRHRTPVSSKPVSLNPALMTTFLPDLGPSWEDSRSVTAILAPIPGAPRRLTDA